MTAGIEGAVGFLVGLIVGAALYRWRGKKVEATLKKELERAKEDINNLRRTSS